jgi:hypothetical protein
VTRNADSEDSSDASSPPKRPALWERGTNLQSLGARPSDRGSGGPRDGAVYSTFDIQPHLINCSSLCTLRTQAFPTWQVATDTKHRNRVLEPSSAKLNARDNAEPGAVATRQHAAFRPSSFREFAGGRSIVPL